MSIFLNQFSIIILLFAASESLCHSSTPPKFPIKESTIDDLQLAFKHNKLTSLELVEFYLNQIKKLNPSLRAVIEVNPDALEQARAADYERTLRHGLPMLHGIPVLLKDNIATKDKLNTTCGSLALFGSVVAKDSGVVNRLRLAGAVILGKASLSEWAHFRSFSAPSGWCARTGQGKEKVKEYGQDILVQAEETKGIGEKEKEAISMLKKLSREGFEKVMKDNELDAIVSPGYSLGGVLAIGGYPGITVPAGYDNNGMPFGLCFGGVRGSDHILIQIAYAFEQATKIRKTPSLLGCGDTGMSDVARQ